MAPGKKPIKDRSGKIHPLFIELYLSDDSDDAQGERRARPRRKVPQQRVKRRG